MVIAVAKGLVTAGAAGAAGVAGVVGGVSRVVGMTVSVLEVAGLVLGRGGDAAVAVS
jgi:hypothetical protein